MAGSRPPACRALGRTSFRALIWMCDALRKAATVAECEWKRPFLDSGTPSPHQFFTKGIQRVRIRRRGRVSLTHRAARARAPPSRRQRPKSENARSAQIWVARNWDPSLGRKRIACCVSTKAIVDAIREGRNGDGKSQQSCTQRRGWVLSSSRPNFGRLTGHHETRQQPPRGRHRRWPELSGHCCLGRRCCRRARRSR